MHKGFFDKRRRFLNLRRSQVESVLPEHFAQYYPKFITLLKKYYDWQDEYPSTELIAHLFASRDINETDITLLRYIEDELLLGEAYFEGFGDTDAEKRAAANFSNIMFRSKGSKFAIEWFFRSFYGLDAEVIYPKENIFFVGDQESRIGPDSLRFITNDKLYQTFALLIRVGVPISKWRDIYKLFVHPAGMYLGAELSINDAVDAAIDTFGTTDSDVVIQRAAPVYNLLSLVDGINLDSCLEGKNVEWVAQATNIPENIGAAFWYVQDITTEDSDFYNSTGIPRIVEPRYLALNESDGYAAGRFNIRTIIEDTEVVEPTEQYKVLLVDGLGKTLTEKIMNVRNAVPIYTLSASPSTTVYEGDTVTFTVTGTNLPNDGNTSVVWYVDTTSSTTEDSDFDVIIPKIGSRSRVNIVDGIGTFTLKPIIDDQLDDLEVARITIRKDSTSTNTLDFLDLTILDVPFSMIVNVPNIIEGNNIVATITVDAESIGQTVSLQITGPDLSRLESTSGSVVMTSATVNVIIGTTADDIYYPSNVYTFSALSPGGGTTVSDTFIIADLTPAYQLVASPETGTSGGSVTFSVQGSNIPDGPVYFFIVYGTATSADFAAPTPPLTASRETVTITSNSGTVTTLNFAADADASAEQFTAYIYDAPTGGNQLASLPYVISPGGYTLTSANTVNEGSSITFTFTAPVGGTYYYWITGTNITSSDFSAGYATSTTKQSFSAPAGSGTFTVSIASDATLEGEEIFTANVSAGSSSTSGALATKSVTINDTSTGAYSTVAPDNVEGTAFTPTVTRPSGVGSETVYVVISGAAATKFATTSLTTTFAGTGTNSVPFGSSTYSAIYEGPKAGTLEVRRGSAGGTLLASDPFTVTDAAATYTLTPSDSTPNEGTTVTFTLGGTNIPNGATATTYYYRASGVVATQTSGSSASGQAILKLASTSGLAVGMTSDTVNGTIVAVGTSSVTMSTNLTSTFGTGTVIHFAQPATWADFTSASGARGSFTVTNNAGSFNSGIALDTDRTNDVYTFSVYNAAYGTSALVSATITIQDQTPSISPNINIPAATTFTQISDQKNNTDAIAGINFLSTGEIYTSLTESVGLDNTLSRRLVGTWIDTASGFNPAAYSLKFTANRTTFTTTGSGGSWSPAPTSAFNTALTQNSLYPSATTLGALSSSRSVSISVAANDSTTLTLSSINVGYSVTVTVFETANPSNASSYTFTMRAESIAPLSTAGGGGGGTGGK